MQAAVRADSWIMQNPEKAVTGDLRNVDRARPDVTDALFEAVDVAILGFDVEGHLLHANRRARTLLGVAEPSNRTPAFCIESLRMRTRSGLAPLDEKLGVSSALRGETSLSAEVLVDTDTETLLLRARANAVCDADGTRLGSVVTLEDVSDPHAREARLLDELQQACLAKQVADALASGRLRVFAQPIVDIASGRTVLEELLLRVPAGDGTLVGPFEFLRAAELNDTIAEIDVWVLEQAVRVASRGCPVAVNVSARTISRAGFLETVERSLDREGVAPDRITFELTETAVVSDMLHASRFAERLNEIGCHFALDDFGTGYAALTYMKLLPIQYVKVDRDFVRDLATNRRSRAVVSGIVSLAGGFGQRTIAEGVEHEQTLRMLGELGVDMAQGFLLGRPAPVLVRQRRRKAAPSPRSSSPACGSAAERSA